jgi:uncharacterized membrane protein
MPSLSAFALSENAMWYRLMHISTAFFFLINAIDFKKYATEFVLAGGIGLILVFDMYNSPLLHNWITALTLGLACLTLLINVRKNTLDKTLSRILVACAIGIFLVGYFTKLHFFFAEVIAMAILATGKLLEIHQANE